MPESLSRSTTTSFLKGSLIKKLEPILLLNSKLGIRFWPSRVISGFSNRPDHQDGFLGLVSGPFPKNQHLKQLSTSQVNPPLTQSPTQLQSPPHPQTPPSCNLVKSQEISAPDKYLNSQQKISLQITQPIFKMINTTIPVHFSEGTVLTLNLSTDRSHSWMISISRSSSKPN